MLSARLIGRAGDSVAQRKFMIISIIAAVCLLLEGCVASQVQENTLEMVDSVAHVRESQVLSNLSSAISDHNMVPTEILLSVGQATVTAGLSPTAKYPKFTTASPAREFDIGASDNWTAQWQVTPVTNADDLRRLRNLYVLIVSTDDQYDALEAYYTRHPEMRAPIECYGLSAAGSEKAILVPPSGQCPAGYGTGVIPRWKQSVQIIETGDSIGCKMFQESTVDARRKATSRRISRACRSSGGFTGARRAATPGCRRRLTASPRHWAPMGPGSLAPRRAPASTTSSSSSNR